MWLALSPNCCFFAPILFAQGSPNKTDLYIFCIGIDTYEDKKYKLQHCASEADSVYRVLNRQDTLYTIARKTLLTNNEATEIRIAAEFDTLRQFIDPEDLFIFYYVGHGQIDKDKNFSLLSCDFQKHKPIPLQLRIDSIKSSKILMIDACYSGFMKNAESTNFNAAELIYNKLNKNSFKWVFSTTDTTHTKATNTRLLSRAIMDAFNNKSTNDGYKADSNGDGYLGLSELKDFLLDRVPELSEKKRCPVSIISPEQITLHRLFSIGKD